MYALTSLPLNLNSSFNTPSPSPRSVLSLPTAAATASRSLPSPKMSVHCHALPNPSLYDVLRVERTASPTEIKTAYRTLAKLYHPDVAASHVEIDGGGDDGRDFIEIHHAYATLSDPSARALYDLSLGFHRRRKPARAGVSCYPTRQWETDQCW